jgi:hypothetical protein
MSAQVKVPFASAEYQVRFTRPIIKFIGTDRVAIIQAIVDSLVPFGFALRNSEFNNVGNAADHFVTLRLPDQSITFKLTAEAYFFSKDNANLSTAEEDVRIIGAVERALFGITPIEVKERSIALAFHLQLLDANRRDVLWPLLPEKFRALANGQSVISHGAQMRWERGSILVDYSAALANGIFVRADSQLGVEASLEESMPTIVTMRDYVFTMLDVSEASND